MKQKTDNSQANRHTVVVGQSGSGKSTWVRKQVRRDKRLIAWDPDQDHEVDTRCRGLAEFVRAIRTTGALRVALTVDPTPELFERWARAVRLVVSADRSTRVVVEELADVTRPAKAGPEWGQLIRKGRKYAARLMVTTQRPQECDKTAYTQAGYLWCGFLERPKDQKEMADRLAVAVDDVRGLSPLDYLYKAPAKPATRHRVQPPTKGKTASKQNAKT